MDVVDDGQQGTEAIALQLSEKAPEKCVAYLIDCLSHAEFITVDSDHLLDSRFIIVRPSLKGLCLKVGS